ncbi:CGI-121-domain-containing protein [Fomitiporia mediterranea MF3/22]|uniref:CGI-121-domain-containing protein n=1 Tax=Fomitiporia mediterranea (strain MF3/22) TaxID=694068 RepID=UPI000440789A|nr:CGI-121-domain-containing protein [Fomitiporia mediterranea MF3/22]EJD00788.1 CGI-121-domain-containing protein [Fomitiporia mediterranea MF3/22]
MESYTYKHFPDQLTTVHVALFTNVQNAAELRARIVNASTMQGSEGEQERDAVSFAFIEAKLVTSRLALQTAVYQSMLADAQDALKTKTVHSEIIWCLNPTNNITEALRRFGVSDNSSSLLVVRVGPASAALSDVEKQMKNVVQGDLVHLDSLKDITDWATIRKYYKLNGEPAVSALDKDPIQQNAVVDELVTSFVAMKSVMS